MWIIQGCNCATVKTNRQIKVTIILFVWMFICGLEGRHFYFNGSFVQRIYYNTMKNNAWQKSLKISFIDETVPAPLRALNVSPVISVVCGALGCIIKKKKKKILHLSVHSIWHFVPQVGFDVLPCELTQSKAGKIERKWIPLFTQ